MKKIFGVFFPLIFSSGLLAQDELNSLQAPSSPASSILGLQPSIVLAPKSYQALETTLYSNFLNNLGKVLIPNDFALEFTPYWTKKHGLKIEDYLYPQSTFEQVRRNSSFSIASTQNFLLGDSAPSNALAMGYRTTLYLKNKRDYNKVKASILEIRKFKGIQIKIESKSEILLMKQDITSNSAFLDSIRSVVSNAVYESGIFAKKEVCTELINQIFRDAKKLPALDKSNPDAFLNAFYDLIDNKLKADGAYENFKSYIKERPGFSLDLAYTFLVNFPTNKFEYSMAPRQSFWLTPSYRFKNDMSTLKIIGVIRYDWYDTEYYKRYFPLTQIYTNNINYGISIRADWAKFYIQFEFAGRKSISEIPAGTDIEGNALFIRKGGKDFQYIVSFNYNLSNEIVLTYNLGNRFDPIQNPKNTLVSLLTLNFGFGTPKTDALELDK